MSSDGLLMRQRPTSLHRYDYLLDGINHRQRLIERYKMTALRNDDQTAVVRELVLRLLSRAPTRRLRDAAVGGQHDQGQCAQRPGRSQPLVVGSHAGALTEHRVD